jgi:hypothetical protein
MLGRHWLRYVVVVAIALAAFWGVLWGGILLRSYQIEHANERVDAAHYKHDSANGVVVECLDKREPTFSEGIICLAEAIEANREAKRSQYDLKAQQEMAEWAFGMLLVSFGGLLLTGFGVIYVVRAFRVATEANVLTRLALIEENRAYISIGETNPITQHDRVRITQTWTNGGNTPAVRARTHVSWICLTAPLPDDFDFPDLGTTQSVLFFIGPHGTFYSSPLWVHTSLIDRTARGETYIYLWGWVDYDDVFEKTPRHRTEFCLQLIVEMRLMEITEEAGAERTQAAISFHHHPRFNNVDEQCEKRPNPP